MAKRSPVFIRRHSLWKFKPRTSERDAEGVVPYNNHRRSRYLHSSFLTPHSSLLTKRGLTKGWKCAIVISIGLNAMTEISSLLRNFRELSVGARKHFYKVWIHSWAVRWESFCVRRNGLHTLQCYGFAFCWACKVGSFPDKLRWYHDNSSSDRFSVRGFFIYVPQKK